jgi:rhamnosyltransferase subunit B
MQILVISAGTLGNVLPFVGLARELQQRGHEVVLGASRNCRQLAQREGLSYVEVDTAANFDDRYEQSPIKRWRALGEWSRQLLHRVYDVIAERYIPGKTVVVCHGFLFGARVAQDKLGVPVATVHLQPWLFRSVHRRPWYVPAFALRFAHRIFDCVLDRNFGRSVNQLRAQLNLPPVKRLMQRWSWSPTLAIGMFPEWFASPAPDWPANLLLAGFPCYDQWQAAPQAKEFAEFLQTDERPLVFSQASLVRDARAYFAICAQVAQRLNRRAILLTANPEMLPTDLPPTVRSFGFVPLSDVLPHAAAFVHHGGMGGIAQALAAGVPQLTIPGFLDQPDNSRRLYQLGVSDNISSKQFNVDFATARIAALLSSPLIAERCRHYASVMQSEDAFARIATALERMAK